MDDVKTVDRTLIEQQLEIALVKLRETGATALSPTEAWRTLRKEVMELRKKLK